MKTPSHISRSLFLTLVAGAMALTLAACGSSSSSDTTSSAAPAGSSTASGGNTVAVKLADFSISMPKMAMAPGTYTFDVTNDGPSAHNLTINGPGVSDQATPTFGSAETKTLTVTLKDGTYDFFCSVPGHQAAGMDVKVTVGSGGGAAATTTEDNGGGSSSSGGGWS